MLCAPLEHRQRTAVNAMDPAPTVARQLGLMYAAHAALTEAQNLTAAPGPDPDLGELLTMLCAELEHAEENLNHALNHQIAASLPTGFAYLPD